jgi:hypothetical protein
LEKGRREKEKAIKTGIVKIIAKERFINIF